MKSDTTSLLWQAKVAGLFMVAASIVGGLLTTFVIPGNEYLSGVLLLMLGLLFVCGVTIVFAGLLITYRTVIIRSVLLPAIVIGRLLGLH
jgi:hypothetical protein